MNKGDDQITKPVPATNHMPPLKEDKDSDDSNEVDDSTGGPASSEREK